jgi:hypothetical protein
LTTQTIIVEPSVAGLRRDHEAARLAEAELVELLDESPELRGPQQGARNPGKKGAVTEIALAVATPGSIAAFGRIFHLWLKRDSARSVRVSVRREGDELKAEVIADRISEEAIRDIVTSLIQVTDERESPAS